MIKFTCKIVILPQCIIIVIAINMPQLKVKINYFFILLKGFPKRVNMQSQLTLNEVVIKGLCK